MGRRLRTHPGPGPGKVSRSPRVGWEGGHLVATEMSQLGPCGSGRPGVREKHQTKPLALGPRKINGRAMVKRGVSECGLCRPEGEGETRPPPRVLEQDLE